MKYLFYSDVPEEEKERILGEKIKELYRESIDEIIFIYKNKFAGESYFPFDDIVDGIYYHVYIDEYDDNKLFIFL